MKKENKCITGIVRISNYCERILRQSASQRHRKKSMLSSHDSNFTPKKCSLWMRPGLFHKAIVCTCTWGFLHSSYFLYYFFLSFIFSKYLHLHLYENWSQTMELLDRLKTYLALCLQRLTISFILKMQQMQLWMNSSTLYFKEKKFSLLLISVFN